MNFSKRTKWTSPKNRYELRIVFFVFYKTKLFAYELLLSMHVKLPSLLLWTSQNKFLFSFFYLCVPRVCTRTQICLLSHPPARETHASTKQTLYFGCSGAQRTLLVCLPAWSWTLYCDTGGLGINYTHSGYTSEGLELQSHTVSPFALHTAVIERLYHTGFFLNIPHENV